MILESPVVPVREGDAVTLRCTSRATSSANLAADFYKDGLLIGRSSTGDLTLRNVCEADQGFYKCNITGAGESPDSWLAVRGEMSCNSRSFTTEEGYLVLLDTSSFLDGHTCRNIKQ